jgi:hypothetical protein
VWASYEPRLIRKVTASPTFTFSLLGKKRKLSTPPGAAEPRRTVDLSSGRTAAACLARRSARATWAFLARASARADGTRAERPRTRTVPFIPGWMSQKYVTVRPS